MGIGYSSRSEPRSCHKIIFESYTLLLAASCLPRLSFLSLAPIVR